MKKLSILALLSGLTYAFLIVNTFSVSLDDLKMIFNEKKLGTEYNSWGDVVSVKPVKSFSFRVRTKDGYSSFPDSLVNLRNNTTIRTKYQEMAVLNSSKIESPSVFYRIIMSIIAPLLLTIMIVIPIHFYKIIGLIKKQILFENRTIRLLRWLGIELLIIYFGCLIGTYLDYQYNSSLFSFAEYNILQESIDPMWLLLGAIVLLIAEIFSRAMVIKEEQELTI